MTPSQKFLTKLGLKDPQPETGNNHNEQPHNSRRSFLKRSTLGGIALGGATALWPIEGFWRKPRKRSVAIQTQVS